MSVSTGTGDSGRTSLWSGQRVSKASKRVEAYGTIDELNCHLGETRHVVSSEMVREMLLGIQKDLFKMTGQLATVGKPFPENLSVSDVGRITGFVHDLEARVTIEGFVVPGNTRESAKLDIARTVARRAERRICSLADTEEVPEVITVYINRLSDLLYMMARYEEHIQDRLLNEKDVSDYQD